MSDTTIKKVEAASSPHGEMGQKYLVAGKRLSMRLWALEPGGEVNHSQAGIMRRWVTYLRSRDTRPRRANAKSKVWGLLVGPSGS